MTGSRGQGGEGVVVDRDGAAVHSLQMAVGLEGAQVPSYGLLRHAEPAGQIQDVEPTLVGEPLDDRAPAAP